MKSEKNGLRPAAKALYVRLAAAVLRMSGRPRGSAAQFNGCRSVLLLYVAPTCRCRRQWHPQRGKAWVPPVPPALGGTVGGTHTGPARHTHTLQEERLSCCMSDGVCLPK